MRALLPRWNIGWAALLLLVCWTSAAQAGEPYPHPHPGIPHGCPNPPQCGWLAPEFNPCTSCAAVTRDVACNCNGLNVVESYCEAGTRPSTSSPCVSSPACVPGSGELNSTCAWSVGDWQPCLANCKHKRTVTCLCEGKVKSSKNCKKVSPEPDDSGVCYRTDPVAGNLCTKPEPGEHNPPGACRWVAEAWGPCGTKCTHSRKVTCQCDDTVGECAEHRCSGAGTPPPKKGPCAYNATEPGNLCPPGSGGFEVCAWVTGTPGACDSKCLRSRSVNCVCDGKRSADASCATAGPEPPKKIPCVYNATEANNKCPPSSGGFEVCAWKVGNFGSCSSKCVRSRSVKCECDGKRETNTTKCAGPEPYKSEPCFYDPKDPSCKCRAPPTSCHWEYGQYGPCTADDLSQCGPGHQTRTARCVDSQGRTVADANCPGSPVDLCVACEDRRKCTCAWVYDEWSACDEHCRRSRVAHCRCGPFPSPDSACGPCADLTESCDWDGADPSCRCPKPPQPLCRWVYPRRWGPCTKDCGLDGVQTREPVCRRVGLLQSAAELAAEAAGRPSCNCGPKPPPKVQRCNVCPCRPRCTWQFRGDNYGQCRPKLFPMNDAAAELVGPPEDSEWCGWGVQFRSAQCFVAPSNYDEDIAFAVVAHAPQPCNDCRLQDKPRDWHDPKPRLCQKDCPAENVICTVVAGTPGECVLPAGQTCGSGNRTTPTQCVKPANSTAEDLCAPPCDVAPDPIVEACTVACQPACHWVDNYYAPCVLLEQASRLSVPTGPQCPGRRERKCVVSAVAERHGGGYELCNRCDLEAEDRYQSCQTNCPPAENVICTIVAGTPGECVLPAGQTCGSGNRTTPTQCVKPANSTAEDLCAPPCDVAPDPIVEACSVTCPSCVWAPKTSPAATCEPLTAGNTCGPGRKENKCVHGAVSSSPAGSDCDECSDEGRYTDCTVAVCTCSWVLGEYGACALPVGSSATCGTGVGIQTAQATCTKQAGAPADFVCPACLPADGNSASRACNIDCPPNSVSCPATACTGGSSGVAQVLVTPSEAGDPAKSLRISVSFGGPPAGLQGDITGFFIDGLPLSLVPWTCSLTEIPGPPDFMMSPTTRNSDMVDGHSNVNEGGCTLSPPKTGRPPRSPWDLGVAFGTGGSNAEGGDFPSVEFLLVCPSAIAASLSPSDLAAARVLVRVQSVGLAGARSGSSHLACLFTSPNPA